MRSTPGRCIGCSAVARAGGRGAGPPDRPHEDRHRVRRAAHRGPGGSLVLTSKSGISFGVKAAGQPDPADLAEASLGLQTAWVWSGTLAVTAAQSLTPLFQGLRVARDFWWLFDEVLPADAGSPAPEDVFRSLDLDDATDDVDDAPQA